MNAAAHRHLLTLVDMARAGPIGPVAGTDWVRESFSRFGATLEALRAVDAVSPEEVHDWNNRMLVALGREPLEPLPSGFTGARAVFLGDGQAPAPMAPPLAARFLRLVPVQVPAVSIGFGGQFQVLGVELYDTRMAVAWRLAPLPDPERQHESEAAAHDRDSAGLPDAERTMLRHRFFRQLEMRQQLLQVADDVGTEYQHIGGGSGGGGDERVGRAQFVPAVPDTAAKLTVRWDAVPVSVDLRPTNS